MAFWDNINPADLNPLPIIDRTLGPDSSFRSSLATMGGDTFLYIWCGIFAAGFLGRVKSVNNGISLKELFIWTLGAFFSSYITFGRGDVGILVIILFGGVFILKRSGVVGAVYASAKESGILNRWGYNARQQRKKARLEVQTYREEIRRMRHDNDRLAKGSAQAAADQARVTAEGIGTSTHEAAAAVAAEESAQAIQELEKIETQAIESEADDMTRLYQIETRMSSIPARGNLDENAANLAAEGGRYIGVLITDIKDKEEKLQDEREKEIKVVDKDVPIMVEAEKKARSLQGRAVRAENDLKRAESKQIHGLQDFIKKKKKEYRELRGREGANEALKAVEVYTKGGAYLFSLERKLRNEVYRTKITLRKMKTDLGNMVKMANDAKGMAGKNWDVVKDFRQRVDMMKSTAANYGKDIDALKKDSAPLSIAVHIKDDLNKFFQALSQSKSGIIAYEQENLYPLIKKLDEILNKGAEIVDSLSLQLRSYYYVSRAFEQLDRMAIALMQGTPVQADLSKDMQSEILQEKLHVSEVRLLERTKSVFKAAHASLARTVESMEVLIKKHRDDFEKTSQLQARGMQAIDTFIRIYQQRLEKVEKLISHEASLARQNIGAARIRERQAARAI